jgi:hypothetical protein
MITLLELINKKFALLNDEQYLLGLTPTGEDLHGD